MPWPDEKALRGFRSVAQSRWAHATNQWWADEYEKHTNYDGLPKRVTEDDDEGIEEYDLFGNKVDEAKGDYYKDFGTDDDDLTDYSYNIGDVDDDGDDAELDNRLKDERTAYRIGERIADSLDSKDFEDMMDWFEKNADDPDITKNLIKGLVRKYTSTMSELEALHENALLRKVVRDGSIDMDLAKEFWDKSVKEQEKSKKVENTRGRTYWKGVIEKFNNKIKNLDVLEAKRIMEKRRDTKASIEVFLDNIAKGEYAAAQSNIPNMVQNQLATMINSKKDAYLKELGKSVKERAKEV